MNSGNVTMNPNDVNRILETKKREKLMRNNNLANLFTLIGRDWLNI